MAEIKEQFIQVKTKANFVTKLTNGEIKDSSIAFIEDSSEIWAKGKYYPCPYTKEFLDNKYNEYIPLLQKGQANGVATLDANGKIPVAQMPENGELSTSLYKIVDTLPTTGIDTSKIYLVPASATTAKNNKTEYIYLGDPNKAYDESKWEKLGDEQKSSTITTPGGSITVDTALIENSPNPVAGGVVKAKIDEIDGKLADKVALGFKEITWWFDGVPITLPCDKAEQLRLQLENYAFDCFNATARHRAAVEKLESVEDAMRYDYKSGYPEKLRFNVEY